MRERGLSPISNGNRPFALPLPPASYLHALGTAAYAFAYLEGSIIDLIEQLSPGQAIGPGMVDSGPTASSYAKMLRQAASSPSAQLEALLQEQVRAVADRFDALARERNDILHAHPMTAVDGTQRLYRWGKGRAIELTPDLLFMAASDFADAAVAVTALRCQFSCAVSIDRRGSASDDSPLTGSTADPVMRPGAARPAD